MKSIMQEASSLMKAIEQAWITAGKPQEFTIKVLEEAQKNFIGLTTRSAKIAFFFGEKPTTRAHEAKPRQPARPQQQKDMREEREPREYRERDQREQREPREHKPRYQAEGQEAQRPEPRQQRIQQPLWTEAMVDLSRAWMAENLAIMQRNITFTIEPQNFHLRITLSRPILDQHDKEKHLLASFSLLLIETLKKNFRTALRGHKIVLTHA